VHPGSSSVRLGALAWVAGEIDTFGYLALGQVFITHMTGNTGVLAIAVTQRRWHDALPRAVVLAAFVGGATCGVALVERGDAAWQIARALLVEALLLLGFAGLASLSHGAVVHTTGGRLTLLLLLSVAMGVQNAALSHPGIRGTHTTHLTGPLTDLTVDLMRIRGGRRDQIDPGRAFRLLARVAGFVAGAFIGALLFTAAPLAPPLLGAGVLIVIAARDLQINHKNNMARER
jgi:uncharacterized membrane protein YoaK (UPF0700 family)